MGTLGLTSPLVSFTRVGNMLTPSSIISLPYTTCITHSQHTQLQRKHLQTYALLPIIHTQVEQAVVSLCSPLEVTSVLCAEHSHVLVVMQRYSHVKRIHTQVVFPTSRRSYSQDCRPLHTARWMGNLVSTLTLQTLTESLL